MSRSLPTSQRLRPPSPWLHPPWIQIVSSRLPMSLMEAPGARACVHYVCSSCLGHRNGAHEKIERWAEHRSWMAFAQWIYATTNQTMVSAMGGAVERIFAREERVGADVWSSFWVANGATKKYLNRDGDGASDFDGFCWIGGHNNQPKIDRIVKLYLG